MAELRRARGLLLNRGSPQSAKSKESREMTHPAEGPVVPVAEHDDNDGQDVYQRIHAEFREMPGLRVTLAQATRLFSLDSIRCERVLTALVQTGVLSTDGRMFARRSVG